MIIVDRRNLVAVGFSLSDSPATSYMQGVVRVQRMQQQRMRRICLSQTRRQKEKWYIRKLTPSGWFNTSNIASGLLMLGIDRNGHMGSSEERKFCSVQDRH